MSRSDWKVGDVVVSIKLPNGYYACLNQAAMEYLDPIAKDMPRAVPSTRTFKWACA